MKPKLNKGLIITFLEDVIVAGTSMTYYYFKGNKYMISQYLDKWDKPAWKISLIYANFDKNKYGGYSGNYLGYFSEKELFEKTNCIKYLRKQKLEKIQKIK